MEHVPTIRALCGGRGGKQALVASPPLMEHAPAIGALCGGRLAKVKGVRYGPPSTTPIETYTLLRAGALRPLFLALAAALFMCSGRKM